jgi:hypothetical protein
VITDDQVVFGSVLGCGATARCRQGARREAQHDAVTTRTQARAIEQGELADAVVLNAPAVAGRVGDGLNGTDEAILRHDDIAGEARENSERQRLQVGV